MRSGATVHSNLEAEEEWRKMSRNNGHDLLPSIEAAKLMELLCGGDEDEEFFSASDGCSRSNGSWEGGARFRGLASPIRSKGTSDLVVIDQPSDQGCSQLSASVDAVVQTTACPTAKTCASEDAGVCIPTTVVAEAPTMVVAEAQPEQCTAVPLSTENALRRQGTEERPSEGVDWEIRSTAVADRRAKMMSDECVASFAAISISGLKLIAVSPKQSLHYR